MVVVTTTWLALTVAVAGVTLILVAAVVVDVIAGTLVVR